VPTDLVQVVLAVLVIVAAAVATFCVGQAADARGSHTRELAKSDQATVEVARHLYQTELAQAFQHISVCARGSGSSQVAASELPLSIAAEAVAADVASEQWLAANGDQPWIAPCSQLAVDPRLRLHELSTPVITDAPDPDYDPGAKWEVAALIATAVPPVVALVFLAVRLRRLRRSTRSPAPIPPTCVPMEVEGAASAPDPAAKPVRAAEASRGPGAAQEELVYQPWASAGGWVVRSELTVAWALIVLLPVIQVALALQNGPTRAEADMQASKTYAAIAAGGQRLAFESASSYQALYAGVLGDARQQVSHDEAFRDIAVEQQTLGEWESARADYLLQVVAQLAAAPDGELDPALAAAIGSDEKTWPAMAVEQNDRVGEAAAAGTQQQRLSVALLIATLVSTIITAARRDSRRSAMLLKLSGGLLVLDIAFVGVVLAI
jgi:hypothetical protein